MNPTNIPIEEMIANSRLAFMHGKYDEALRIAKQALDQDSKNPDAHQCAGNAYMSKANYESSIIKRLLRMMPITVIDTSTLVMPMHQTISRSKLWRCLQRLMK